MLQMVLKRPLKAQRDYLAEPKANPGPARQVHLRRLQRQTVGAEKLRIEMAQIAERQIVRCAE
jgi:hypothetical protein